MRYFSSIRQKGHKQGTSKKTRLGRSSFIYRIVVINMKQQKLKLDWLLILVIRQCTSVGGAGLRTKIPNVCRILLYVSRQLLNVSYLVHVGKTKNSGIIPHANNRYVAQMPSVWFQIFVHSWRDYDERYRTNKTECQRQSCVERQSNTNLNKNRIRLRIDHRCMLDVLPRNHVTLH